jgi:hypothetical protein
MYHREVLLTSLPFPFRNGERNGVPTRESFQYVLRNPDIVGSYLMLEFWGNCREEFAAKGCLLAPLLYPE